MAEHERLASPPAPAEPIASPAAPAVVPPEAGAERAKASETGAAATPAKSILGVTHNARGRFLKGHHIGRPKGVRGAEKAYLRAAPKMVKAYLKRALAGNPMLLQDYRRAVLPFESDLMGLNDGPKLVVFLGDGALPRRQEGDSACQVETSENKRLC